jgi:hypothetical protein
MRKLPGIPKFMQNEPLKILCFGWEDRELNIIIAAALCNVKIAMEIEHKFFRLIKIINVEYWGNKRDIAFFKVNI